MAVYEEQKYVHNNPHAYFKVRFPKYEPDHPDLQKIRDMEMYAIFRTYNDCNMYFEEWIEDYYARKKLNQQQDGGDNAQN